MVKMTGLTLSSGLANLTTSVESLTKMVNLTLMLTASMLTLVMNSLSIQKIHEWPQHVVGVSLHLVFVAVVQRTSDLVQKRRHLSHAVVDATLETDEETKEVVSTGQLYLLRCLSPYLFPKVLLSSSRTLFSFTCRSFSKSLASGSI